MIDLIRPCEAIYKWANNHWERFKECFNHIDDGGYIFHNTKWNPSLNLVKIIHSRGISRYSGHGVYKTNTICTVKCDVLNEGVTYDFNGWYINGQPVIMDGVTINPTHLYSFIVTEPTTIMCKATRK